MHGLYCQSERCMNIIEIWQKSRQTDRQTEGHYSRQADIYRQTDRQTLQQAGMQTSTDRQTDRQTVDSMFPAANSVLPSVVSSVHTL